MKDELQKQMDGHKNNKDGDKSDDLRYFEVIRSQKEKSEMEDIRKRDHIKKLIEEQRIIRDRQIAEHDRVKHQARREKREDGERLRLLQQDLSSQKNMEKEKKKEFKDKIMNDYRFQIQNETTKDIKASILNNTIPFSNDMMNQLFEEKRNIPKEMMAA